MSRTGTTIPDQERNQIIELQHGSPICLRKSPNLSKFQSTCAFNKSNLLKFLDANFLKPNMGGSTVFLDLEIQARPIKNSAVFWYNHLPNGSSDDDTNHDQGSNISVC